MMLKGQTSLKGLGCGCGCKKDEGQANYTLNGLERSDPFTLPQNPIRLRGLGFETSDYIPQGVADFFTSTSTADALAAATGWSVPAIPNWAVALGGLTVIWFVTQPSGKSYRAERRKLRAKYAGYRQVTRKTGAALSAI